MKAHFELNDLKRDVDIGCAEEEHGVLQEILISIRVTLDANAVFSGETYQPPYDYCDMIKAVDDALASKPRFVLQETLFFAIATRLFAHPLIEEIELSLLKTQRYASCKSLGMRASLSKVDLQKFANRYNK